ncbi:MAG: NAD(P)-dependent alcohol dehydrogenase [Imperialibacter sp.]|uniref:NAD(P)-dependent alcohol dehydrogenase n=1 Tax=Imperialibacter sp. TaxID=2038411 RepID=UPI0032EEA0E3
MMKMTMKAIVTTKYGSPDVLQLQELKKPVPKEDEVLIKIHASTVTAGDCEMRRFDMPAFLWLPLRLYFGAFKPRIKVLGQELTGEIEAVGKSVTKFNVGDAIFAPTQMALGGHAEYICLPEKYAIALKPQNMSFEEAATLPTGGLNAQHFIRKGNVKKGDRVLINGAGGCIGTYAVQIAKSMGAEVTAVDSGGKLKMLSGLGADHVIDYTKQDFGQLVAAQSIEPFDVIIDIVGKGSFARCVKALAPDGTYVMGNPRISGIIKGWAIGLNTWQKVVAAIAPYKVEDLNRLKELAEKGEIKAVIDKVYPLEHMADAHRYVETGAKAGNVVITIKSEQ